MKKKATPAKARKSVPRRRRSSKALVPVETAVVDAANPAWKMFSDMCATVTGMAAKIDVLEAKLDAAAVVHPKTMFDAAKALTIKQACDVLSRGGTFDDGRLYNRPHLIHRAAGTCYVDADEIRAEFPDDFSEAKCSQYIKNKNDNKNLASDIRQISHRPKQAPAPQLLSRISGNDKRGWRFGLC